ncbi:MAG: RidA family protein [Candidatus Bathyarchaeia archaeon]
MKKQAINPKNVWKPEDYFNIYHSPGLPRTPAAKSGWEQSVKAGNWLFISGQTPTTPKGKTIATDMHAQLKQALENTRNIVKAAGGRMDDIVSIRYYFKSGYMEEGLAALRDLGGEYFKTPYPSTTCVEVVRVAWPEHHLEIEAIAILQK